MNKWNNFDHLALNSALQLDFLRSRREGNNKKTVNLNVIYAFMDKLSEHQKTIQEMLKTDNFPTYYLFHNTLIDGILDFYDVSFDDYRNAKKVLCSDFIRDIKTGLDMLLESFNNLEFAPTKIQIKEINLLRDFCLMVSERELHKRTSDSNYRYVLTA
ncbi:hypothetical protein HYW75_03505 [Candidatus Pacearchaeota archaeon]|nr:hypothetical protein [Candidatus Pacearchaeota archaeon]